MICVNDRLVEPQDPPSPSSLDTTETNLRDVRFPTYGESLRASFPNEWPATLAAYKKWDEIHGTSKAFDLKQCRSFATFNRNVQTGLVRIFGSSCRLRWCPLCGQAHAKFLSQQVQNWYKSTRKAKMLTLTIKSADSPLTQQINKLFSSFRKLRTQRWFTARTNGGIWFFQVTFNSKTQQWHPHLHALLDGDYLAHQELSARWLKITGDSDIIDIRKCWSPESAATHVARYATRPGTLSSIPDTSTPELLEALQGRRICGSWGSARRVQLHRPKADDTQDWQRLGTWEQVMTNVPFSDAARAIALAWRANIQLAPGISMLPDPDSDSSDIDQKIRDIDAYYNHSLYDP